MIKLQGFLSKRVEYFTSNMWPRRMNLVSKNILKKFETRIQILWILVLFILFVSIWIRKKIVNRNKMCLSSIDMKLGLPKNMLENQILPFDEQEIPLKLELV